jgi:YVTN family beta-propeller protein
MNAEAEKLQFVLGTLGDSDVTLSPAEVSLEDLLDVNASVQRTLRDVIKKEMLLEFKFENVLDLIATIPPPPPPPPPAAINRIYVSNQSDNNVSVIDGVTNTVIATVPVGSLPTGVGVNP